MFRESGVKDEVITHEELMERVNKENALIKTRPGISMIQEHDVRPKPLPREDVVCYGISRQVWVKDRDGQVRKVNPIEYWLENPDTPVYKGIAFEPDGCSPEYYNLWRGLQTQPIYDDAKCRVFLDHIFYHVARENHEVYDWVMDWLASIIQDPAGGPKRALVLLGKPGTGKSFVGEYVRQMIGPVHSIHLGQPGEFSCEFNSLHMGKIFVQADRSVYEDDKRGVKTLKDLITSDKIKVKEKWLGTTTLRNCAHYLVVWGNTDPEFSVDVEDQKFVMLELTGFPPNTPTFFDQLGAEMDGDGPAALLGHLLTRKLDSYDPEPPEAAEDTESKAEAKLAGLGLVGSAVVEWASNEQIGDLGEWPQTIPAAELIDQINKRAENLARGKVKRTRQVDEQLDYFMGWITITYKGRRKYYILPDPQTVMDRMETLGLFKGMF